MTEFEFDVADRTAKIKSMKELLPEEYKQCWILWGKVYKEYERLNYRLT